LYVQYVVTAGIAIYNPVGRDPGIPNAVQTSINRFSSYSAR